MDLRFALIAEYPIYGWADYMAVAMPECLPERMSAVNRITDLTTQLDDYYDLAQSQGRYTDLAKCKEDIEFGLRSTTETLRKWLETSEARLPSIKALTVTIALEMLEVDEELARNVLNGYYLALDVSITHTTSLTDIKDYIRLRIIEGGYVWYTDLCLFGMNIRISPESKSRLAHIANLAIASSALINDLYSWPKEVHVYIAGGLEGVPLNSVGIVMRQFGVREAQAIELIKTAIRELQELHLDFLEAEKSQGNLTENELRYLLVCQNFASGTEIFSYWSPRYKRKEILYQGEVTIIHGKLFSEYYGCNANLNCSHVKERSVVCEGLGDKRTVAYQIHDALFVHAEKAFGSLNDSTRRGITGGGWRLRESSNGTWADTDKGLKNEGKAWV